MTQAEDAFGFSVGRESLGIYNADNARGFSPTQAGNVRIDGLYFDPEADLTNALVDSVSIRVGLSAQGYPFAAPSGIVDQRLRTPAAKAGASAIVNFNQFGSAGAEIDGSLPLTSRLSLGYGINGNRVEYPDGTHAWNHSESLLARLRTGSLEVIPFWSLFNDYVDQYSVLYVPAGAFLPRMAGAHRYEGPSWSAGRHTDTNLGVLSSLSLGQDWILRFGIFRSLVHRQHAFSNLFLQEQSDGTGERVTIADPPSTSRSLSGELRLAHSIADGPRLHVFHLSIRGRDAHREFGGAEAIDEGPGRFDQKVHFAEPEFEFGELSRDAVQQLTYGVAYTGRWKGVGEIGLGISRAEFRKTTIIPGEQEARLRSSPWLYNGDAAINITPALVAYVGYARGLEESGVAPANAVNRNQPLPVVITEQKDAGVRANLATGLKAIVGVFDLSRPYFGYEANNIFKQVGTTQSRGLEFSLSGQLTPRLSLVAGGVILRARVVKGADVQGVIGERPVGLPGHDFMVNANWKAPRLTGIEFDVSIHHRGRTPARTDNAVFLPARAQVDIGTHYKFTLGGKSAVLRLQLNNIFDNLAYGLPTSGVYYRQAGRFAWGYLTIDI